MRDNLRLKATLERTLLRLLPAERVTRLRNLTLLMTGLFLARTVHLSQIVRAGPLPGRLASLENRLRRFVKNVEVCPVRFYRPVVEKLLSRFAGAEIRLLLDVTQVGPAARMLSLSVAYRKRALPLAWRLYRGVKGNVPMREVCKLLEQIRALLPSGALVWVLGDSSFGQEALIRYVRQQGWHFVLRLGGHAKVRTSQGWYKLGQMDLQEGQTRDLAGVALMQKHALENLYVLLHWKEGEEEPWYLVSDQPLGRHMLRYYERRMWTDPPPFGWTPR